MNVAYIRISTADQEAKGTQETQRNAIEKYCSAHGIHIDEWLEEQESGASIERGEFKRLMDGIQSGIIKCIVVYALDRFSRNTIQTLQAMETFKSLKVSFHAIRDNICIDEGRFDKAAEMLVYMFSWINKNERETIRARTLAGKLRKMESGLWVTGQPPVGYELDKVSKVLKVNEPEADLVRRMFDMRINHIGVNGILRRFNQEKVPFFEQRIGFTGTRYCKVSQKPRKSHYCRIRPNHEAFNVCQTCIQENGGKLEPHELWGKTTITKILKNRVYEGRLNSNGRWIKGKHEAIIRPEVFETVQKLISEAIYPKERCYPHNPLAGMIFCGQCGSPMHVTSSSTKKLLKSGEAATPYMAFRCSGNRAGICSRKNVKTSSVYERFFEALSEYLHSQEVIEIFRALYEKILKHYDEDVVLKMREAKNEIAIIDKKIEKLNTAYIRAGIAGVEDRTLDGLLKEMRQSQDTRDRLHDKCISLESKADQGPGILDEDPATIVEEIIRIWDMCMFLEGKPLSKEIMQWREGVITNLIRGLLVAVTIHGEEMEFYFQLENSLLDKPVSELIEKLLQTERLFQSIQLDKIRLREESEKTRETKFVIDYMKKNKNRLPPCLFLDDGL